jgi:hypothetical protein
MNERIEGSTGEGAGSAENSSRSSESGRATESGRNTESGRENRIKSRIERGNTNTSETRTVETDAGAGAEKNLQNEVARIPVKINIPERKEKKSKIKKDEVKNDNENLTQTVNMMLMGIFGLVAGRAGEHWNITLEEASGVSLPLSRILERLGFLETANQYGDYVALITAVGIIVIPRVLMTQNAKVGGKANVNRQGEGVGKSGNIGTMPVVDEKSAVNGVSQPVTEFSSKSDVSNFKKAIFGLSE